jgi:hypothetical protein
VEEQRGLAHSGFRNESGETSLCFDGVNQRGESFAVRSRHIKEPRIWRNTVWLFLQAEKSEENSLACCLVSAFDGRHFFF